MNAIELLERAIEAERAAQAQYREGAQSADDAETRMLFEQLAHWEESHEALLRERVTSLRLLKASE